MKKLRAGLQTVLGEGARLPATIILMIVSASPAGAQDATPDPSAWRSISYADLQWPSADTATYTDIWKDAIDANNRAYLARGDKRFAAGNAPVTEAHFVIWSSTKSVVLSILDTATGCTVKNVAPDAHAVVKLCPLRIAIYEGLRVRTMEGGHACFLELRPGSLNADTDPSQSTAYVSYDIKTKTLKTGMVVSHRAVDGCSLSIPLPYP